MSAAIDLSILDFQHPGRAVTLACAADELGYKRYWLTEHHDSPQQCANPLLLGALLAGTTERIRIGSGGVSLAYRTSLQTAEDARLIEFMLPGRFDLGVTRGLMEAGPVATALLERTDPAAGPRYEEKVRMLHGLITGRCEPGHPLETMKPYLESGPPFWLLGLSPATARLAGSLGVGFCFSVHHAVGIDGPAVIKHYKDSFIPSPELAEPAIIVVVRCTCAGTEEEAKRLEARMLESTFSNETVVGSPSQCASRIVAVAEEFSTSEVMIIDFIQTDWDARLEMYRLLSRELGLIPSIGAAGGDHDDD